MAQPSTASSVTRVIELSETNYSDWSQQERAWIRSQNALSHIEPPANFALPVAADELEKWQAKDNAIAGRLLMTMPPAQKAHVDQDATAAVIWSTMRDVHRRVGFDTYHGYQSQLTALRYVDGTSMQAYLHRYEELRSRIRAAGLFLPEEYYCSLFIASLPDTWDTVSHALRNSEGNTAQIPAATANCARCTALTRLGLPDNMGTVSSMGWKAITTRVLTESLRRQQKQAATSDTSTALAAATVDTTSPAYQAAFAAGHAAATAAAAAAVAPTGSAAASGGRRSTRGSTPASGKRGNKVECEYCHTVGHTHTTCYKLNGYPADHARHDPQFVRKAWTPPAPTETAGSAQHREPRAASLEVVYGWTAVEAQQHCDSALSASTADSTATRQWVVDGGATAHFCNDRALFSTFGPTDTLMQPARGPVCRAAGRGSVPLAIPLPGGGTAHLTLHDVVCIPDLHENLLSAGRLLDLGFDVQYRPDGLTLTAPNGALCGEGTRAKGGLFRLAARGRAADLQTAAVAHAAPDTDWHARFGHADSRAIMQLFTRGMANTAKATEATAALKQLSSAAHCEPCLRGKQTRAPLTGSADGATRASRPLQIVHMDLCGPYPHHGRDGSRYLLVIVDDATRYLFTRGLLTKDQAFDSFCRFKAMAETQHCAANYRVAYLRTDNGGEFLSNSFSSYLEQHGIRRQLTAPYTSSQNGVAERAFRTINDAARTMLHESGLPYSFFFDAVAYAVYVRNRLPTSSVAGMTRFEAWFGYKPRIDQLRPFGCVAHVHIPAAHRTKMDPRSHRCVFIGISADSKQYRLFDPATRTVIQSRDVQFDEHLFGGSTVAGGGSALDTVELFSDSLPGSVLVPQYAAAPAVAAQPAAAAAAPAPDAPAAVPAPATAAANGRSLRSAGPAPAVVIPSSVASRRGVSGLMDILSSGTNDVPSALQVNRALLVELGVGHDPDIAELSTALLSLTSAGAAPIVTDPLTPEDAMRTPQAAQWKTAMQSEFDALQQAGTYTLVPAPPGVKPIGVKWVLKTKRNAAGEVVKYKARVVAKGYAQRYGIDYEETYAPVCRIGSIRVLIALAAHFDWHIHHMDVTSAFLNGDLEETVYMEQPPGFEADGPQASYVCKLRKSLYGLKQAGRTWNVKIDSALQKAGFVPVPADLCVYRHEQGHDFVIVSLYVDDLLLFSNSTRALTAFKQQLSALFHMTDLGEASFVLGIQIIRNRQQRTIALSQASYSRDVVSSHGADAINAADTPVQSGVRLVAAAEDFVATPLDVQRYQSAVGALMWAAVCTRPDLSYAVGQLSQHASKPDKSHFRALFQCIRYLRGTVDYRLKYTGEGRVEDVPRLTGYSDSDWAGDIGTRRSTTGYVFQLCGGAVSWQSKRQKTTAQSTVEAEYMAAASATKEAIWLRALLGGIGCPPSDSTTLRVDNEGSIALASNPRHHELTKHIAVRHHLIREHVSEGTIALVHVPTELQAADGLTKALSREKHTASTRLLGLA